MIEALAKAFRGFPTIDCPELCEKLCLAHEDSPLQRGPGLSPSCAA